MKRLLSILLIMLLILPMAALAEEPFSLRNGYYWGMSKAEAMKLAQEEGLVFATGIIEPEDNEEDVTFPEVYYENVLLGEYTACLFSLCFKEESGSPLQLYQVTYMIQVSATAYDFVVKDITLTLTHLYGIPTNESSSAKELRLTWRTHDATIDLDSSGFIHDEVEDFYFLFISYQQSDASSTSPAIKDGGF